MLLCCSSFLCLLPSCMHTPTHLSQPHQPPISSSLSSPSLCLRSPTDEVMWDMTLFCQSGKRVRIPHHPVDLTCDRQAAVTNSDRCFQSSHQSSPPTAENMVTNPRQNSSYKPPRYHLHLVWTCENCSRQLAAWLVPATRVADPEEHKVQSRPITPRYPGRMISSRPRPCISVQVQLFADESVCPSFGGRVRCPAFSLVICAMCTLYRREGFTEVNALILVD